MDKNKIAVVMTAVVVVTPATLALAYKLGKKNGWKSAIADVSTDARAKFDMETKKSAN